MAGKRRSKKKKVLFAVEILVLLVFIGGLYVYGQLNTKLDKIQQPVLDESKIKVKKTLLLAAKTVIRSLLRVSTMIPKT